ncbi:hypothetical protein PUN28_018830 [Cardiocondyla obscurior]|uniref:Uncharacterized protein n=1 Tax=Cardiocondyla obscurior TaxID=286306 RepID=A0AAW2EI53_9HYME
MNQGPRHYRGCGRPFSTWNKVLGRRSVAACSSHCSRSCRDDCQESRCAIILSQLYDLTAINQGPRHCRGCGSPFSTWKKIKTGGIRGVRLLEGHQTVNDLEPSDNSNVEFIGRRNGRQSSFPGRHQITTTLIDNKQSDSISIKTRRIRGVRLLEGHRTVNDLEPSDNSNVEFIGRRIGRQSSCSGRHQTTATLNGIEQSDSISGEEVLADKLRGGGGLGKASCFSGATSRIITNSAAAHLNYVLRGGGGLGKASGIDGAAPRFYIPDHPERRRRPRIGIGHRRNNSKILQCRFRRY